MHMKFRKPKTRHSIQFAPETAAFIDRLAQKKDTSFAGVVREIVENFRRRMGASLDEGTEK